VSVVLLGESGTGKEVMARALHGLSGRAGAFMAVNCGALPSSILEAELFGYRKGAFSGSVKDNPGLIRSADHGTLFLDEIGELAPSSQVAFLRVLQEQEVLPIGESKPIKVDTRLCTATHRDLEQLVEAGGFRRDLYARLSGYTLRLPPLRERREDLGLLIAALLQRDPRSQEVTFTPDAMRTMFTYEWPLNIRELEKCLSTARVLARGGPIELRHLPEPTRAHRAEKQQTALSPDELVIRDELIAALTEHRGNVAAVSRVMGKGRMQIHRWAKRFGLVLEAFRR
jgi:transcriptional regulator with GAF, ATPase, and Fis domain